MYVVFLSLWIQPLIFFPPVPDYWTPLLVAYYVPVLLKSEKENVTVMTKALHEGSEIDPIPPVFRLPDPKFHGECAGIIND
jgi:hypothetical protein